MIRLDWNTALVLPWSPATAANIPADKVFHTLVVGVTVAFPSVAGKFVAAARVYVERPLNLVNVSVKFFVALVILLVVTALRGYFV